MPVKITVNRPHATAVKLGIIVVIVFACIGLFLHFSKNNSGPVLTQLSNDEFPTERSSLIPIISLDIPQSAKETDWVSSLQQSIKGEKEANLPYGRVDLLTTKYAIEVDYFDKWKEGLGQAIYYGKESNKIPCLALIVEDNFSEDEINTIDALCTEKGVRLILLKNKNSLDSHSGLS